MSRVLVTGMGTINPLGSDLHEVWNKLLAGVSGIRPLTQIPTCDLDVQIGGEVLHLDPTTITINDRVSLRRMERSSQFAILATRDALLDARLPLENLGPRAGVYLGAGLSGLKTLQEQTENLINRGTSKVSPFTIPLLMPNASAANISIAYGITGPTSVISTACASSGHAIIAAAQAIASGQIDFAITGGTEASLTRLGIVSFLRMKAMATGYNEDPEKAVRPFSADRKGLIMSEGAGIVVLESEDSAKRREVTPYAELMGYGVTTDAQHLVRPDEHACEMTRGIKLALGMSGLSSSQAASRMYVNAHGTGTVLNDLAETKALQDAFGPDAAELQISSTKSMTGHLIGASCGLETIISILALKHQMLPPTINLDQPDPACPLDYIPHHAREARVEYALNNSFAFGGHNVSLIFKRL